MRWNDPFYLGSLTGIGPARGFDIWNRIVYLCDGNDGLRIIDITDPTNPKEIAYYNDSHYINNVFVSNDIAYATGTTFRPAPILNTYILNRLFLGTPYLLNSGYIGN